MSNLPKGYKQTEVGVIPEDWDIAPLGQISDVIMGQSPVGSSYNKSSEGKALINGPSEFTDVYPVKVQWTTQPTKMCKINDLLICVRGSSTGRMNVSDNEYCIGRGVAAIRAKSSSNTIYLTNQIYLGIEKLLALSTGSTFPNVDGKSIRSIPIPLPPTKDEQTAIANVLSDADALIQSLEKLITKKRNIKQGAMQELLNPMVNGELKMVNDDSKIKKGWVVKKLGEVVDVVGGGTPSTLNSHYWNGEINWFTPTEIGLSKYTYGSNRKITKDGLNDSSAKLLPIGAILLTSRASIGEVSILMTEGCTNQGFQSLIAKSGFCNEFIYYLTITLKPSLIQNASGSTFLEISPGKVKQIEISIPAFNEQTRIATILSDMDAEIAALESKLSKYKMVKQGMMQELLTGKTRLI